MSQIPPEKAIKDIRNTVKQKYGILCINCLFTNCKIDDIIEFIDKYRVIIPQQESLTRLEYLKYILAHFLEVYYNTDVQKKWDSPLTYTSEIVINDPIIKPYTLTLDFIAKQDLIDIFADFCADRDLTVYQVTNLNGNKEWGFDLYLTKNKPVLKTEAVILKTGAEMNEENYNTTLKRLKYASKYAISTVFVTTPIGAYRIGLERLINDMESLNIWLYIVDPGREHVFGVVKGKKNESYTENLRDDLISKLPREPIRAASQVVQLSHYYFNEAESYKSSDFGTYEILTEVEHNKLIIKPQMKPKFTTIFQDLMIIDKSSGTLMVSYSSKNFKDQTLTSSFLSAMDTFITQIGGSSMEEINYKGFYVQAAYEKYTKVVSYTSEPASRSFKERLMYLNKVFERNYYNEILQFQNSGDIDLFNTEEIHSLIQRILDI